MELAVTGSWQMLDLLLPACLVPVGLAARLYGISSGVPDSCRRRSTSSQAQGFRVLPNA